MVYIYMKYVVLWFEHWPADLVIPGAIFAGGRNLFHRKRGSMHTSFHFHPNPGRPDITEMLLKRT